MDDLVKIAAVASFATISFGFVLMMVLMLIEHFEERQERQARIERRFSSIRERGADE